MSQNKMQKDLDFFVFLKKKRKKKKERLDTEVFRSSCILSVYPT